MLAGNGRTLWIVLGGRAGRKGAPGPRAPRGAAEGGAPPLEAEGAQASGQRQGGGDRLGGVGKPDGAPGLPCDGGRGEGGVVAADGDEIVHLQGAQRRDAAR